MERELKFTLPGREVYDRLAEALGKELSRETQVNHYLDTPGGELSASGRSMMRVRDRGTHFTTTFKYGIQKHEAYYESEETQTELPAELAAALRVGDLPLEVQALAPVRRLFEVFGPQERLVPQGSMRNLRRLFHLSEHDMAELDETVFDDGTVDYELEVETNEPGRVLSILELLGFGDLAPQPKTKYARFLERL